MTRLNNPRYAPPRVLSAARVTTDQAWVRRGSCRDQAPHWDSTADAADRQTAMRICRQLCPVRDLCAAAGKDETTGIWGGVDKQPRTEREVDPSHLATMSETHQQKQARATAEFIETIEEMAADGLTLRQVCDRLEKSSNTIRQRLRGNGRRDLIATLIANRERQMAGGS